ncbi:RGCVC family protein [Lentzea aerocolonigenes]|uniref:RGCVC family protein n=1 Tax=Lentzea aerocolonigenes TaxID=68170 RepID=UPI0018C89BF9
MPTSEPRTAALVDHADASGACDVCPHPWQAHDPLSTRYCTATTASALSRGCICP